MAKGNAAGTLVSVGVFGAAAYLLYSNWSTVKAAFKPSANAPLTGATSTPYGLTGEALQRFLTAMNASSVPVTNQPGGAIGPMPATTQPVDVGGTETSGIGPFADIRKYAEAMGWPASSATRAPVKVYQSTGLDGEPITISIMSTGGEA